MALLKLDLPPGMTRPGTIYKAMGRWFSGNLVRWFNGVFQAWGGWQKMFAAGAAINLNERVCGMFAWRRNAGSPLLALGTPTKLWVFGTSTIADETPGGFVTGLATAAQSSGAFGAGAFGAGPFGVGDEAEDTLTEANWWQFANWHEDLLAWAYSDRKIYLYDTSAGTTAALTNAPTNCAGVVVTPENFVVALGPSGVPRRVQGADVDDPTIWADLPDNTAFNLDIHSEGRIVAGRATSRETLIWTDVDVHALRYVGGEFIYGAQQVGRASLISGRAMGIYNDKAAWMGMRSFFIYDGEVKPLPSEVADYVFNDLNYTQASKIHCVPLQCFQELVWFYPSAASTECDRYVAYNWLLGHMYTGELSRTAGVDYGIYPQYPILADSFGAVYRHEILGASYSTLALLPTVRDSYSNFNTNGQLGAGGGSNATRWAQVFQLATEALVTGCAFTLSKTGAPTGSLTMNIYNTDTQVIGTAQPTGSPIASATLADVTTLPVSPTTLEVQLTFTTPVLLAAGVYAVDAEYSGGDASNYVRIQAHAEGAGASHPGESWWWIAGPWTNGVADLMFKVFGRVVSLLTPNADSGPVELGAGDEVMDVSYYIPDENTLGAVNLSLLASRYPTGAETVVGPFTAANPTSVRVNARQVRLRIEQVLHGWRFGTPRLDVQTGEQR